MVVGPPNSEVCADNSFKNTRLSADMCVPAAAPRRPRRYVDHVLLVQDAVNALQGDMPVRNLSGAEEPDDYGMKALNYRSEPLWARRGGDPSVGFTERNESDYSTVMSSAMEPDPARANGRRCRAGIAMLDGRCEPETPILTATTGSTVRLHFVHAGGHTRQQGLAIGGHHWNPYPWSPDSRELRPEQGSSIQQGVFNGFGPMMGVSLEFTAGPPRDYLVNSMASFSWDGGTWGLLRVLP